MLETVIQEVAPRVEALTEWNVPLENLKIKVVRRHDYGTYGIRSFYSSLGIDPNKEISRHEIHDFLTSYILLGQYDPSSETIIVIQDNLKTIDPDGLSLIVGHELTHHAQFVNNASFTSAYLSLLKTSLLIDMENETHPPKKDSTPQVDSFTLYAGYYHIFLEGDATFVERQLQRLYYPKGIRTKPPFLLRGLALLFRFLNRNKNLVDLDALTADYIAAIHKTEGRRGVNSLYETKAFLTFFENLSNTHGSNPTIP